MTLLAQCSPSTVAKSSVWCAFAASSLGSAELLPAAGLLTTRFHAPAQASRRESEDLAKFAADFGCRGYSSYEAMAGDAEVDIVYVATIHPTHHPLAKMSLLAGKHVLVEKPFTMNHRQDFVRVVPAGILPDHSRPEPSCSALCRDNGGCATQGSG